MTQRQAGGVVPLRRAADQKPAAPRTPGLGGETLRALKRRIGADVDSLDSRRDVVLERGSAEGGHERGVRPFSPLVSRYVEASGFAFGVSDQGVEVWRLGLIHTGIALPASRRLKGVAGHGFRH